MELGPDTETMGMPSDHERVLEATQLAENPQNPTEVEKMELKTHLDLFYSQRPSGLCLVSAEHILSITKVHVKDTKIRWGW